jgi:hypothetical protein
MGARLRSIADVFVEHRATMILLHHTTKGSGADGLPIDLENLSFAGFREFSAQWLLLSRRERYEPGSGHHALWLSSGGRAGHSGLWGVDADEGVYQPGVERLWNIQVMHTDEIRQQAGNQREVEKEAKRLKNLEADKQRLCRVMVKYPQGETENVIRAAAGLPGVRSKAAMMALLDAGEAVAVDVPKPGRRTPFLGYKLVIG